MYNPEFSYEQNYAQGPFASLVKGEHFSKIRFLSAPNFSFLGTKVHLPLGIPAGPLLNSRYMQVALDAGFCTATYKTVRSRLHSCHPWPNVLEVTEPREALLTKSPPPLAVCQPLMAANISSKFKKGISITNSFGVPSQAPLDWADDFAKVKPSAGQLAILSFQGTRAHDGCFEDFAKDVLLTAKLAASSSSHLEINLSCPNEAGDPIYSEIPRVSFLLSEVRKQLGNSVKLIAKIGVLHEQLIEEFFTECGKHLDAISAINTVSAKLITADGSLALGENRPAGGICGGLILQQSKSMFLQMAKLKKQRTHQLSHLELIAVGGVSKVEDVLFFLQNGASCVQAATGVMWDLSLSAALADSLGIQYETIT